MEEIGNKENKISYNFCMGNDWMFFVLREKENIEGGISLNALGCLGSVLVKNKEEMDIVRLLSPENIL